ncbi:MAG: hypothetical protein SV375_19535 [Thermodesulfobacteriota bacterium]|nr:hypothetical protein [Thermodesulfobacteriota bacterium]
MREPKQITIYNQLKKKGWCFGWRGISGDFFLEKDGDRLRVTTCGKILSHNQSLEMDGQKDARHSA